MMVQWAFTVAVMAGLFAWVEAENCPADLDPGATCSDTSADGKKKPTAPKTILLTGATDGIGLETAKLLVAEGHKVLLHGRSSDKLARVEKMLKASGGDVERYVADLSKLADVEALARAVGEKHKVLDVLINNAGVLKAPNTQTRDGFDLRLMVNTISPYLLTRRLAPQLAHGRVVNVASAAQAPVDLQALAGKRKIRDDMAAYSQSKLGIMMWTYALSLEQAIPVVVSVNPGSFLGSKMVKEGFGIAGNDISIGSTMLTRAALSDEFSTASGKYYDNDERRFSRPHADAVNARKSKALVTAMDAIIDA